MAMSLLTLLPGMDAQSAANTKLLAAFSAPGQMMVERTIDANDFVKDMTEAAAALKAYSFDYETQVFKGKKVIDQQGSFYFKQPPRMLRVEMTGDYKHGSVAVLGRDGKIRGHLGGALGAFTITIAPDSDMLLGANGYPLVDSDFAGMCKVIQGFIAQGCKARVSDHPVSVEGQSRKVYVLEITRPNSSELYKRAYIDPQSMLPLEWFDYQNNQLFARTVWKDLKIDPGIKDDVFKI
jgi:outer membrane lipoprotein-sorting protein